MVVINHFYTIWNHKYFKAWRSYFRMENISWLKIFQNWKYFTWYLQGESVKSFPWHRARFVYKIKLGEVAAYIQPSQTIVILSRLRLLFGTKAKWQPGRSSQMNSVLLLCWNMRSTRPLVTKYLSGSQMTLPKSSRAQEFQRRKQCRRWWQSSARTKKFTVQ